MKRLVTVMTMLALSLVLAVQPAAAAASFPDVPKTDRFHDEIQFLVDQDIISGYSNGKFQPKKNVTRGEAAIMIGRMLDLDDTKRNTTFKDVSKSHGASGYIASAADKGIITGLPDGTFRPDAPITRGDMAIILDRAFGLEFISATSYPDVGVNMKSETSILRITSEHITTGYSNGNFKPLEKVTREQFSAFLARGISPAYRQRAVYQNGYAHDLTKKYIYSKQDGDVEMAYKQGLPGPDGVPSYKGFLWHHRDLKTGEVAYEIQEESSEWLMEGSPYSDYYMELSYPLTEGKKWDASFSSGNGRQVTAVNETVSTPYKTFTNAVELTTQYGDKIYYVKGIGYVKSINSKGEVYSELKAIQ